MAPAAVKVAVERVAEVGVVAVRAAASAVGRVGARGVLVEKVEVMAGLAARVGWAEAEEDTVVVAVSVGEARAAAAVQAGCSNPSRDRRM